MFTMRCRCLRAYAWEISKIYVVRGNGIHEITSERANAFNEIDICATGFPTAIKVIENGKDLGRIITSGYYWYNQCFAYQRGMRNLVQICGGIEQ